MIIRHTADGTINASQIRALIRRRQIQIAGNRKLKIYGTLHCISGKKMLPVNRVFFSSAEVAIQAGYRPCGHCMKADYRQWKAKQDDNTI